MRCVIIFALILGLAGCSQLKLEDVAGPTVAAGVAAGTAVLNVHPAGAVVAGAAAGIATEVAIPDPQAVTAETLKEVQNPWQAFALSVQALLDHAFELVVALSLAIVAVPALVTFALGKVMPRRKEKEVMEENRVLKKLMDK